MTEADLSASPVSSRRGFSGKQVLLFLLIAVLITAGLTWWYIRTYLAASDFEPVMLSANEQVQLDDKLAGIGLNPTDVMPNAERPTNANADRFDSDGRLIADRYSEDASRRHVRLSERELNAMIASNPETAKRLAIDLSSDLASAKLLVDVPPDFPMFGGQTIRLTAGLEMAYANGQPQAILRGVSVGGVPVPNSWLGGMKNVDLVEQFGGGPGFWQAFADGVESISISDGELDIRLKE